MEQPNLQRNQSGRNPKKAEGQRLSLGSPSKPARQRQSFYLVICGTHDHKADGWIFSDFMGICMALHEHGVGGDFLSCFPVEEHFIWLRNVHIPAVDTIKFGKYGKNKEKALYTYSRHTYLNRRYWWTQVGVHELLGRVERWIHDKQQIAKPGDVINIILEGHGTVRGKYKIGDRYIDLYVFRDLLAGFEKGVQVNAIVDVCHSGRFIDILKSDHQKNRYMAVACGKDELTYSTTRSVSNRIRNGRFAHAFVQSLARVSLPGAAWRNITWRVTDHEGFMREQLMRNLTPGATVIEPHFLATNPINGMTLVEELIFRDKVDISYDPRVAARRRRMEWPTTDPNIRNHIISQAPPTAPLPPTVKALLETEVAKCDTKRGLIPDLGIYEQLYTRSPDWRMILRNLYWRARRQSAVWDIFELLVNRGFINPVCLTIPVSLLGSSEDVWFVSAVLECFSFPDNDNYSALQHKIPAQTSEWAFDIQWLATMIVRAGADIPNLLETIETSHFLGSCVMNELAQFRSMYPEKVITQNPRAKEGHLRPDGSVAPADNVFGFWLTHGVTNESPEAFTDAIRKCKARFNEIERAFREVEGIPKNNLWLEEEQVTFFEANPELLPGATSHTEPSVVHEFPPSY